MNNFLDPTPEMLSAPKFEAIWQCISIKSWDINVPEKYSGYMGATGNHVRAILDALRSAGCLKGDREFLTECYDPDVMTREELITALTNELHDVRMLADHCSKIYEWATNGRISKPNTFPCEVISVAEDIRQEELMSFLADEKNNT